MFVNRMMNDPDFAEVAVDAMGFVDSGITREEFAQQFLEVCDWNEDYKVQWEELRAHTESRAH